MTAAGMMTACSHCHTVFRVTAEQLKAHDGDVRCGRCGEVFNAIGGLVDEPPAMPQPAETADLIDAIEAVEAAEPVEVVKSDAVELGDLVVADEVAEPIDLPAEAADVLDFGAPPPEELPEAAAEAHVAEAVAIEPETTELDGAIEPEAEPEGEVLLDATAAAEARQEEVAAAGRSRRRTWLWLTGAVLLLLALLVQGTYFYRTEIASQYPPIRPALERLCAVFGCQVPLPRYPDLLSIESSALEADQTRPNVVILNAILRNRAKFSQAYPLLELTLTDTQDKAIGRKSFTPREYLAKGSDPARGMPPGEDVTVKLYLGLGDLKAVGYRVYLFYP